MLRQTPRLCGFAPQNDRDMPSIMTGSRMALKKAARFLFRLFRFDGKVERHKYVVGEQMQKCGGFACLPGPRAFARKPRAWWTAANSCLRLG